ncbi:MAG TPA: DinB family protein [Chitinophagales bacterium]|nr:DinB family protein [Chitinophagales bacterium]MCB0512540.1 damage-inducible protein DinB [Bacteroidota bacterium]MCB0513777.1 damage-inducible protein DinB [Bacteroidota bacterium]MCB9074649.1 damage-inducible protein DinB [Chitinophagales bacterium]HMU99210.1 DinB family protein [Chitinophagales bacterium]
MSISHSLLSELKHEAESTKNLLAVVPLEKGDWKPHEKSMSLSTLTIHVAELFAWIADVVQETELDFANYQHPPKINTTEELLNYFNNAVQKSENALQNIDDAHFFENWTLRKGDQVFFALPRVAAIRSFVLNHIYHHRGQLTVYLRLLDVKLPGIYGPSADSVM